MPTAASAGQALNCSSHVRGPRRAGAPQRCARCRAEQGGGGGGGDGKTGSKADASPVNEDVLAKLRQFEEENKKLKSRLQEKEGPAQSASDSEAPAAQRSGKGRIDGTGLQRETFGSAKKGSWLSEGDIDFFTGSKRSQPLSEGFEMNESEHATVRKRILIALGATAAVTAFAFVPNELLDGKASKPVFYYLVPILRSVELLDDLAQEIQDGSMTSVPSAVKSIMGKPNEARSNMYNAIEYLERSKQQSARELLGNFVDLVQSADYNKYYDTIGPKDGKLMAQYQDFSLKSVRAAAREGRAFIKLFPYTDVNAARDLMKPAQD